jgi:hypothetical protein
MLTIRIQIVRGRVAFFNEVSSGQISIAAGRKLFLESNLFKCCAMDFCGPNKSKIDVV